MKNAPFLAAGSQLIRSPRVVAPPPPRCLSVCLVAVVFSFHGFPTLLRCPPSGVRCTWRVRFVSFSCRMMQRYTRRSLRRVTNRGELLRQRPLVSLAPRLCLGHSLRCQSPPGRTRLESHPPAGSQRIVGCFLSRARDVHLRSVVALRRRICLFFWDYRTARPPPKPSPADDGSTLHRWPDHCHSFSPLSAIPPPHTTHAIYLSNPPKVQLISVICSSPTSSPRRHVARDTPATASRHFNVIAILATSLLLAEEVAGDLN